MSIDYLVQSENFHLGSYEPFGSFDLLESHIRLSRGDTPIEVVDPRFETPYTTWKQLHACSALRLTLWCLKPSDSISHKILQNVVYIVCRPVACILDLGVDLSLSLVKTLIFVDLVAIRIVQEIVIYKRLSDVTSVVDLSSESKLLANSWNCFLYSYVSALVQIWDIILTIHFSGPGGGGLWSYSACNLDTRQNELVLDLGKVKFLREKCGWEHVTDEVLKKLGNTWSFVNFINRDTFSYQATSNRYYIEAEFNRNPTSYYDYRYTAHN
ncbi:MAG: hypothetical protein WCG10_00490 [Chlamydiota bacterium]